MRDVGGRRKSNMRDVARQAGVSVATVSRVLNGTAQVSLQTQERVRMAVQALKFVPSPAARAINSGRSHMVGALVPTLAQEIFPRFLNEMEGRLSAAGLSLVVATTDYDSEKEFQKARDLLNLGIEALVVSGLDHSDEFYKLTTLHQVPVISTSRYDQAASIPAIGYDNRAAAQLAWDHLRQAGHEHILVLSGPLENNDRTRERVRSLRDMSPDIDVKETEHSVQAAINLCETLLSEPRAVTALLCLSDVIAHGALIACKRLGLSVPSDISVIGIDDLPGSAFTDPPLTSVHLPVGRMGQITAGAIIEWLERGLPAQSTKIECYIEPRGSVCAPSPLLRPF